MASLSLRQRDIEPLAHERHDNGDVSMAGLIQKPSMTGLNNFGEINLRFFRGFAFFV